MTEAFRWVADETFLASRLQEFPLILLIVMIAVCIAMLSKGAPWMIDGVVYLARETGLPRIVIGATIVSLGTTTPEAFVSVTAAWMGNGGLALGNGVGSIIADTALIFGLTCLFTRVPVNRFILNRTGWVQVGSATLLVLISLGALGRMDPPLLRRQVGVLFLFLLCGYMFAAYVWARQGTQSGLPKDKGEETKAMMSLWKCWGLIVGGIALVIVGARILVPSAAEIARRIGVPDDVIAATMVAFGTSLPELMTAVTAVRKGHPEIVVGNVVGADVLNCLFVIGAAAAAKPLAIPTTFYTLHFPTMILILYLFRAFIFMNTDGRFRRWQGACLFGIYLTYLVLQYTLKAGKPLH